MKTLKDIVSNSDKIQCHITDWGLREEAKKWILELRERYGNTDDVLIRSEIGGVIDWIRMFFNLEE